MNINNGILFAAIAHYGVESQLDQTMEECLKGRIESSLTKEGEGKNG